MKLEEMNVVKPYMWGSKPGDSGIFSCPKCDKRVRRGDMVVESQHERSKTNMFYGWEHVICPKGRKS